VRVAVAAVSAIALAVVATAASAVSVPRAAFLQSTAHGVAAVTLGGRVAHVFRGYALYRPRGLDEQMLDVAPVFLRTHGRTFAFDPVSRAFAPSGEREVRLPRGARLFQDRAKVWLTVRGKRDLVGSRTSRVFVSERRDVVTLTGPTAARGYVPRLDLNRAIPKDCRVATTVGARWYLICGYFWSRAPSTIRVLTPNGRVRVLVPPATRVRQHPNDPDGSWVSAWLSPDGKTLLLQWSGECETPSAWYAPASGGKAKPLAGDPGVESFALGWAPDGRAVVRFPRGLCGAGIHRRGIYLVDVHTGRKTFVRRGGVYLP
jgi:hypothetical protein